MSYNFDYSSTMMMKMLISEPDNKGGSNVKCNLEQALEIIKKVDALTFGCPKIIYLVGWQYDGHDDKYPAFFEVNPRLKREQDESARDSLIWLMEEGKKYNTTVSLHVNFVDAYPNSPLWQEYIEKDLILKNCWGKPKVTGVWNSRICYQTRLKAEWESGYFAKRIDKLFDLLPLADLKTLHVDAFFVRLGKTPIREEKKARLAMIDYCNQKGVDITSEFIYREHNNGFRAHFGKSDTIGKIPAFWWTVLSRKDVLKYPAKVLAGGMLNKSLAMDKSIEWLIYGNMQGEDLFVKENWEGEFAKQFATMNLPYFFLNKFERKKIVGFFKNRCLIHSHGVTSSILDKTIIKDKQILKFRDEVFLPLNWLEKTYLLYTAEGGRISNKLSAVEVKINKCCGAERIPVTKYSLENNILSFDTDINSTYLVEIVK